ncbi:hypothetical protein N0V84_007607 [Fusarium piperis]|uniref:Uncharacterized protein n=1 Tax=Fusarium piperis TaxID=1435070 RepID=A0A9W9BN77_9HYPO|nr:hypothetical protein N0V84_007607 [Fusarium piperis]
MPLANVSPRSRSPDAVEGSEAQQRTTESIQADSDVDTRGPGAEVLRLAALKETDPTHILFRRFTELASLSLDLEGNHLEQLGHDLRQMILTGDEGVNEFNGKFMAKLGRYLVLTTKQDKFNPRTSQGDNFEAVWISEDSVRFVSVGIFNTCVGVFVVAPMAIQRLNVTSPAGEVATYLVFVLVAGFLIQMLIPGFTRQLLVYLAYAGVMAAVMRQ